MSKHWVIFKPYHVKAEVAADTTILAAAQEQGLAIESTCGGKGKCGKCVVQVQNMEADGSSPGPSQEVLACRALIDRDMVVNLPPVAAAVDRKTQISVMDLGVDFKIDPGITAADQACAATQGFYGVAADFGTTTVVASLWDLIHGKPLGTAAMANTQSVYGADVISRITYCAENEDGLSWLQQNAAALVNQLLHQLCDQAGINTEDVLRLTVAGNTTMTHILAGLDPTGLAKKPFTPVVLGSVEINARKLGISMAADGLVHILPNIAAFLGSDAVAVVLAAGLHRGHGYRLAVDIGTNGEIILAGGGRMVACSAAAGPAFEGARIKQGMRATAGAIEKVVIDHDVTIETIGGDKARGICGSGLIDTVAEMFKAGLIDSGGKIIAKDRAAHLPPRLQQRLGREETGAFFILAHPQETAAHEPILLYQQDVRQLQLAKGAIKAGIQILLAEQKISINQLDQVLLAGAFGNYINPASALAVGLLPPVPLDKIKSLGNAAGLGAQMALLSQDIRKSADGIARSIKHMDLSSHKDFPELFLAALGF